MSNEDTSTPIGDEAQKAAAAAVAQSDDVDDEPDDESFEGVPETAKSFKIDVKRALERTTHDGKGDDEPGPSTFQGFATEGVEKESS